MAYYRETKIFETLNGFAARKAMSFRNSIRWHKIKDISVIRKKDFVILLNLYGL